MTISMVSDDPRDTTSGNFRSDASESGSHSGLRWRCGQTHMGRAFEARDNLIRQGFEVALPLAARVIQGEIRIAPLFGPYLFVRFDLAKPGWRRIHSTRGMARLFGPAEAPTPVQDSEVERVLALPLAPVADLGGPPVRGEAVRAVEGPYRGLSGICLDITAGTLRAWMVVGTGPADVEMPAKWCRRA